MNDKTYDRFLSWYIGFLVLMLFVGLAVNCAEAQVYSLAPSPQQFFNASGSPLSGGMVWTYAAGTSTPLATYTDSTGNTPNTNPVILDSAGFPSNAGTRVGIWFGPQKYKLVVQDQNGVQQYVLDNVSSNNLPLTSTVTLAAQVAPSCVAAGYVIWADTSATRLKMCNNGTVDVIVGATTTDTLTNKTLTTPTINGSTGTGTNTYSSSAPGTAALFPLQENGNGANPLTLWQVGVGPFTPTAMVTGSNIIPSSSTQLEMDGVLGIVKNQTTTTNQTNAVGLRGEAIAGANGSNNWGGNFLCFDYDEVSNTYTSVICAGIEVDINTKSTGTNAQGIQLIEAGPATPTSGIGLNIIGQNGGKWAGGVVTQNGSATNFAQIGSQGATGVGPSKSGAITWIGYNASNVATTGSMWGTPNGGWTINPQTGVGFNVSTNEPRGNFELDVNNVSAPDAINANIANGFNLANGNVGIQEGATGSGTLRGFIQARNVVGANNSAYPLSLNELGGGISTSLCLLGGATGTTTPAACGFASAGRIAIPASQTTYVVNTNVVTASSTILIQQTSDNSGLPSSPTCNATATNPMQSARTAGTSFTFTLTTNAAVTCYQYWIIN